MGQALVSKKFKGGASGKFARNSNVATSKAKSGNANKGYAEYDEDDFEDKYIVSGPSAPVKFKSGPPVHQMDGQQNTGETPAHAHLKNNTEAYSSTFNQSQLV